MNNPNKNYAMYEADRIAKRNAQTASAPLNALRHHVTGAIERGEATAIVEQRASAPETRDANIAYAWQREQRNAPLENDSNSTYCEDCGCRITAGRCKHGIMPPATPQPASSKPQADIEHEAAVLITEEKYTAIRERDTARAQADKLAAALQETLDALYNETAGKTGTPWITGVKSIAKARLAAFADYEKGKQ